MTGATAPTFKDSNRAFQHIVREVLVLRAHNQRFKPDDPQDTLLHFSEACMTILALEHFVRIILGPDSNDKNGKALTLHPLLERAVTKKLIQIPHDKPEEAIGQLCSIRNSFLHGNFDEAAKAHGCTSTDELFTSGKFISTVDVLFWITNDLIGQIDVTTGKPRA